MKKCPKCKEIKSLSEFGKDKYTVSGLSIYCKECRRKKSAKQKLENREYHLEYSKRYRENNREILREKARKSFQRDREKRLRQGKESYYRNQIEIAKRRAKKRRLPEEKEKNRMRMAEWRKKNKEKVIETITKWKKDNPEKANAHSLVLFAIKTGILKRRESCEECEKICKTEGHHTDYSKPLDVVWLCKLCHLKKHQIYR